VREAALEAARGADRGIGEIDAVFDWVQRNIEFRGEYGETLQEPRITLRYRAGDCDDQSMLSAAMLQHLGYETRFRTVALRSSPDEFSHVYVEVYDKRAGAWVPLDTTVAGVYPGWQPEEIQRSAEYGYNQPAKISPLVEAGLFVAALLLIPFPG